jgi:hypothetical protein
MSTPQTLKAPPASLARYWLGGRRGMIALAVVAAMAALILNWNWLVTIGLASLLIAALPCVAMCALGLCLNKMGGKSCSTSTTAPPDGSWPESDRSRPLQRTVADDVQAAADHPPVTASLSAPAEIGNPLTVKTSTRSTNDV